MRPEILVPSWIPSPTPPRPSAEPTLLGERFRQAGLLTSAQIAHALREQRQTHLKFGEVCLERGWITPEDLYQQIPSYTLGLGELLVLRGHLAFDQLRVALAQQRRYGRKLGEILVWRGWLQEAELEKILEIQHLAQSLQFGDAWEAIHELRVLPEPQPEPEPELEVPDTQPAPLANTYEVDPETRPLGREQNSQLPAQIAALQLKLEMQQREWQAQIENLEMQWTGAEQEYQQQIAQLQEQLRFQQQEHKAQQQEIIQRYRRQVRSLEAQITRLQADYQQAQEMLTHSQAHIDSLEDEIQSHQERPVPDPHQYQHQIQTLQDQWTQEYQARQQLETLTTSLRAQVDRITDKLQRLRPLADKYRQLSEENQSLSQELARSQAQVKHLRQQLVAAPTAQPTPSPPDPPSPSHQALQVLARLQQADLIQEQQSRALFRILMTKGGEISSLLAKHTDLSPTTIRFFTEEIDPNPQIPAPPLRDPHLTRSPSVTISHPISP